jgi:hypothetical protein
MQDLFISVSENKLRISTVDSKLGFKSVEEDLTKNVINDYTVVDVATFTSVLGEAIAKISNQPKNRLLLNFVLEPQDVVLRFFTLGKGISGDGAQIVSEIKTKIPDENLDDLYFSYQKIAPFLYQFIGVKKELLEKYIEISNSVGIGLKSIIPWVLLLPKYTESTQPAIFVTKRGDKQVIALSELNGIFYTGAYEKERSSSELSEFIKQISFYNRTEPIKSLYTLNYDSFSLSGFNVNRITLPIAELDQDSTKGFEINILTNFMLDKDPTIISNQNNVVNLLPLPEVAKKSSALVYVGSGVAGLVIVGALIFFGFINKPNNTGGNLAQNTDNQNQQAVLSETKSSSEPAAGIENQKPAELKKSDLKIRVENGTGLSGLAAKTKEMLTGLGYNVVSIDTASETRKETLLRFNKKAADFKTMITADTKDKFQDAVIEDSLADGLDYDLLIIIGGNVNL